MCLSACINQVKLSLPGTFDLVQTARKLVCECLSVCLSVCQSGYGDYRGGGPQRGGITEAGTTEAQTEQVIVGNV